MKKIFNEIGIGFENCYVYSKYDNLIMKFIDAQMTKNILKINMRETFNSTKFYTIKKWYQ